MARQLDSTHVAPAQDHPFDTRYVTGSGFDIVRPFALWNMIPRFLQKLLPGANRCCSPCQDDNYLFVRGAPDLRARAMQCPRFIVHGLRVVSADTFKDKGNITVVGSWTLPAKERESFSGIANAREYSNESLKFEGREDDGDIRRRESSFKTVSTAASQICQFPL